MSLNMRLGVTALVLVLVVCVLTIGSAPAEGEIFGTVHGIVHDPQHRPVQDAMVDLKAQRSDWVQHQKTNGNGEFDFGAVPAGRIHSHSHLGQLPASAAERHRRVQHKSSAAFSVDARQRHRKYSCDRRTGNRNDGFGHAHNTSEPSGCSGDSRGRRTNSLAIITDYVPGAYITHDQLHIRGGHQTSWLVDGVPVPNTNIASNLGPQLDPKDFDYMEVNRGSYGAEFGDRTYGVFNLVPRTGFERNNEAELVLSGGSFYQTNAQLSFGSHTERFAYYASVNGNRSDLGLQPPVPQVVHDAANGYGGFTSLIFNVDPSNQLRFVTSLRRDYYQIPYDPNPNDVENAPIAENGVCSAVPKHRPP